jgi:hypothetical protein
MATQNTQFDQALSVMAQAMDIASPMFESKAEAVEYTCSALVGCYLGNAATGHADTQIHELILANPLGIFTYATTYQSLLAQVTTTAALTKRKKHGAFYTPTPLVDHIVQNSVLKSYEEFTGNMSEFRVCDPAVGVGAFLLRSLFLLADQIDSDSRQQTIDTIVHGCLYGVDIDPVAVMLCRAVLACETANPREAFEKLAGHIKVGNAVVGATPELVERGIASDAFVQLDGDDKRAVSYYKKRNTKERLVSVVDHLHHDDPDPKLSADAWCAAYVWRKHVTDEAGDWDALTQKHLDTIRTQPGNLPAWMRDEIDRLALEHRFFHWHLEFPEVITRQSG